MLMQVQDLMSTLGPLWSRLEGESWRVYQARLAGLWRAQSAYRAQDLVAGQDGLIAVPEEWLLPLAVVKAARAAGTLESMCPVSLRFRIVSHAGKSERKSHLRQQWLEMRFEPARALAARDEKQAKRRAKAARYCAEARKRARSRG